MTPHFRNPWLWLRRIRKRCGYGVHSPFAFSLLEEVVYESLPYYAFQTLDAKLSPCQRFRVRRYLHLLFRLANYQHPSLVLLSDDDPIEREYLLAAVPHAKVCDCGKNDGLIAESGDKCAEVCAGSPQSMLVFLGKPNDAVLPMLRPGTMLLLSNVHRYPEWWKAMPSVVSFDLYDLGIAFFDPKYNKQDYIVNF